tara:strand:- start:898 stop:2673 length:1776 start_codon:yes stop_codon:yes gene_type:complete
MRKAIYLIVTATLLTFSSSADTVIQIDTPNPGDTTTTVTTSTTTSHTTDNLITQDFTDGSWEGTNQSSRHGDNTIAGIGGKYVESTITQSDTGLTDAQIQRGFTSTLGGDIWFWDGTQDQSVTMTQTYDDKLGNITTQNRVVDYDSSYYNTYTDTITVGPNLATEGEATVRFDFTHTNTSTHRAADLKNPTLSIDYTNVTTSSTTSVEYCYMKTPPTCPAQEEISAVDEVIEEIFEEEIFDTWEEDVFTYEDTYTEEIILYEEVFSAEDDFFFEDEYYEEYTYEPDYVELDTDLELEEEYYATDDNYYEEEYPVAFETMSVGEEYTEEEYFEEEAYVEMFTDEEFIEEIFEEMPVEDVEMTEEYFEEKFEEYFEEEPEIVEETEEEYIVEEEAMEEEPVEVATAEEETMEEADEVEEQPSSESTIADEPEETADVTEQEESPDEGTLEEGSSGGDVESEAEEKPKVDLDIKVAAVENAIKNKISNEMQRVSVTLEVVNEIISREMIAAQPDMSSYFIINNALFDTRQLDGGNPAFFTQLSLDSYTKTIYNTQVNLVATDPIIQYQIKLNEARSATDAAYIKLKGLLDARSN